MLGLGHVKLINLGRIIVAGGGGGASYYTAQYKNTFGGGTNGGGNSTDIGGILRQNSGYARLGGMGTQTKAGNAELHPDDYAYYVNHTTNTSAPGGFGMGGTYFSVNTGLYIGGGGGGWYGGGVNWRSYGGGGSGYVYTADTAKNCPEGCKLNSTYYLTNAQTIAGNAVMPAPGGDVQYGQPGDGYARITLIK